MAQEDMVISLATNALKANPELITKLTTTLAGQSGSELLKQLAANPVFQTVAKQLVTTEAFQQFIIKLASSEIGKTIVVNGAKFIVTQEMQNGLGSVLGGALGGVFGGNTGNSAAGNTAANVGGQIAMSVLGNILGGKK